MLIDAQIADRDDAPRGAIDCNARARGNQEPARNEERGRHDHEDQGAEEHFADGGAAGDEVREAEHEVVGEIGADQQEWRTKELGCGAAGEADLDRAVSSAS